jgi:pimeloyl-ACP methyl ester carboxylesterase
VIATGIPVAAFSAPSRARALPQVGCKPPHAEEGPAMTETVILLHGLWMRRPVLWPLASRLRTAGFAPRLFAYATILGDPRQALPRLAAVVRGCGAGPVHLVGHSLGGVLALALHAAHADLPPGRIVCLGAPIAGSRAARRLGELHLPLAGRSRTLLEQGVALPAGREVGMLAGSRGMGGGQWITRFDGPHDGSVAVAETRVHGLADHLVLPVSHSGLMFAPAAAAATVQFLRCGRFMAADGAR